MKLLNTFVLSALIFVFALGSGSSCAGSRKCATCPDPDENRKSFQKAEREALKQRSRH